MRSCVPLASVPPRSTGYPLSRPVNSPKAVYQIESSLLALLQSFATPAWETNLSACLESRETLRERYAQQRKMKRIPVKIGETETIYLTPGGQNVLIERVITEFAPRFTPGGLVLYVGDTGNKFAYFDESKLRP